MVSEPLDSINPTPLSAARGKPRAMIGLAIVAAGPIILAGIPFFPWLNQPLAHRALGHLLIALAAALIGVAMALLVLHVARRASDGRVFLVGMGFLGTASIFATHALATPGALMSGRDLATSFSALFSLILGAAFFALSGLRLVPGTNAALMRRARLIVTAFFVFVAVYNWAFLVAIPGMSQTLGSAAAHALEQPHTAGAGRYDDAPPATSAGRYDDAPPAAVSAPVLAIADTLGRMRGWFVLLGLSLCAFAALRHLQFYRRAPSWFGLALTCGIVLFGEALLTQYYAQSYSPIFWLYHVQEFLGFGAIGYAVLVGYRRGLNHDSLLESLLLAGTRARLQARYIGAMDALIDALAHGDRPPPALRATLRERIGLTDSQVQVFERAALAVAQERRQRRELERLNATLRQVEEHKSQLTQMVVHDLKNPLTALISYLDVLSFSPLAAEQHELVVGALRSSQNLSGLIGDLLDVTRIDEGQLELDLSWFAAQDLLRDCIGSMQSWLAQEDKSAEIVAPAAAVLVHADIRLMRRVVLNLLSNAIKHTPPGTRIVLSAAALPASPDSGARVAIEIADNGPGIPPERLERIFQRFGNFASQPNARQTSTGLGLTFCRLVVEAHGGSLSVASTLGDGATFQVLLPA